MTRDEFLAALRRHFGLNEGVDGDGAALCADLAAALNRWPDRPTGDMEVAFTFGDRLVAYAWEPSRTQQAWEVRWRRTDGESGFAFSAPVQVQGIAQGEPVAENTAGDKRRRLVEQVGQTLTLLPLEEAQGDGARRVRAIGITADVVNGNGRRYRRAVLADAIMRLRNRLGESAGQGRLILTGEAEHPSSKGGRPNILETVVKWEAASLNAEGMVMLEGVILPTSKGRDILTLVEHHVPIDISQRGYGTSQLVVEDEQQIEDVTYLEITGYDLVTERADPNARLLESQAEHGAEGEHDAAQPGAPRAEPAQAESQDEAQQAGQDEPNEDGQEQTIMNLEEVLNLLNEKPDLREQLLAQFGAEERGKLAESLGVDADGLEAAVQEALDAQRELARRKHEEAIDAAIREACKDLAYGDAINAEFVEAVRAAGPAAPDAVRALVETKRKEYDAIMSKAKLASMGKQDVQVLGPVFEQETGQPDFTRPAFLITERLAERGMAQLRDVRQAANPAQLFAKRYLEAYDRVYQAHLSDEARRIQAFEEQQTTADLNIPYSVQRAIIAEAVPELVALSVFDFGMVDTSPTRIYFENYTPEAGAQPTVGAESVTSSEGAWLALANGRIQPNTVTVTSDPAGTTYDEYNDYLIDYANGRLYTVEGGAIGHGAPLLVGYTHDLVRGGEMAPIQRGKGQLSFKTIELLADRLAQQISDEAVTFARTQLQWDATARTMAMIIREIREMLDGGVMRLAIAQAHVAGNNGGTWNSAGESPAKLVEKMGAAKVAVQNHYYTPTSFLMSLTNADRLTNWESFTAAGARPDAFQPASALGPGDTGVRVKGLPVFASTEMPDNKILVQHRELVQYRVLTSRPMTMKGPFPSYHSDGKLIAAEQYYVEEYNTTESLIPEKGGYVTVA